MTDSAVQFLLLKFYYSKPDGAMLEVDNSDPHGSIRQSFTGYPSSVRFFNSKQDPILNVHMTDSVRADFQLECQRWHDFVLQFSDDLDVSMYESEWMKFYRRSKFGECISNTVSKLMDYEREEWSDSIREMYL